MEEIKVNPKSRHIGYKFYFVHDNGSRPFLVYLKSNSPNVYIYKQIDDIGYIEEDADKYYLKLVKTYDNVAKTYVPLGHEIVLNDKIVIDPENKGNTILLQLQNGRCVVIGFNLMEFDLEEGDAIKNYYSLIGANDVPYPVIVGQKNIYFVAGDNGVYRQQSCQGLNKKQLIDGYTYFYGHEKGISGTMTSLRNEEVIIDRD